MSTVTLARHRRRPIAATVETRWLLGGLVLAFAVPFLLADVVQVPRDAYYALYVVAVFAFVGAWAHRTQAPIRAVLTRGGRWSVPLGLLAAGVLTLTVLREPSTPHPHGWTFAGALLWRGVGLHASALVHGYDSELFLPPHR